MHGVSSALLPEQRANKQYVHGLAWAFVTGVANSTSVRALPRRFKGATLIHLPRSRAKPPSPALPHPWRKIEYSTRAASNCGLGMQPAVAHDFPRGESCKRSKRLSVLKRSGKRLYPSKPSGKQFFVFLPQFSQLAVLGCDPTDPR